ncbi:DUF190 domain-containing protein [Streptomyces sp. NPDC046831]|uniref:DUF190 domain-containing protein n=1 Tax=Streptomyces sp. NPDC046831 TaxID=3154805 RepID=UPI0033D901D9
MMRLHGRALRLTIVVDDTDTWHHKPLFTEIVHRAHAFGLAGATVLRGVEGFGASSVVHTARLLSLADDLPMVIVIVDEEDRVRAFLSRLEELPISGLVTLQEVEVVRYQGREAAAP